MPIDALLRKLPPPRSLRSGGSAAFGRDDNKGSDAARDVRSLGELSPAFENLPKPGFVRIHSNHTVNPHHIRELRHRDSSTEWEVKLQPPVNRVLPVSRNRLDELLGVFEG